jgi:hypothetical protein
MLFLPRQARDKHRENSKKDRFLARRRPCGPPAATRLAGGAETNTPFEWFPYVCPEPVLVKSSFIYINGSSKRPFCYLRDTAIAFSHPRNKTILLPRQARDTRERTAGEKKRRFPFRFEFTSGYIGLVRVGPSSAVRTETCFLFYCAISLLRDGKATIFCQDRLGTSMWKCQDRLGTNVEQKLKNDVTTLPAGGDLRPDASGPGSAAGAARTAGAARASRRMQGEDSYPPHSRLLQLQRLVRKCGVFWLTFHM